MPKRLTELDLQAALDEADDKRYRTHLDWCSGIINFLNGVLSARNCGGNCTCGKEVPRKTTKLHKQSAEPRPPAVKPAPVAEPSDFGFLAPESCKS